MIKINTGNIPQDGALIIEDTESADILDLHGEENFPLFPVSDISYRLSVVMVRQDLLVTGSVQVQLETLCARCLEKIHPVICKSDLCLHFENCPDQEKDITEDIREELLLSIPLSFHCSEDCKGLCSHCGANLNHEKCSCGRKSNKKKENSSSKKEVSPWDVLDSIR